MKNDYDFIKEKFESDNMKAPDRLSEFVVIDKLPDIEKKHFYNKTSFKAFVSAAACFVLVCGILIASSPKFEFKNLLNGDSKGISAQAAELESFESYDEIKELVKDNLDLYENTDFATIDGFVSKDDVYTSSAASADEATSTSKNHSQTYVQVDGVDEGDIIKNDGKYIYYSDGRKVYIYEGTKLVSTIDDFYSEEDLNNQIKYDEGNALVEYSYCRIFGNYISDIYLKGKTLIVNTSGSNGVGKKYKEYTTCNIYDLTDIKNPKFTKSFKQTGCYSSSRMIGDTIYLVSNYNVYDCGTEDDCKIELYEDDASEVLDPSSIYRGKNICESNFVVISVIDTAKCERSAKTKAFFGCSSEMYCSLDNMYLTTQKYVDDATTDIIKVELDKKSIRFTATATVKGYINSQFSMDEKDGYFRIATTDDKGNNLYILDSNLKKVGEVKGFAENEDIQAVKYLGDYAYVITYEFTDPLFIIDLTNPKKPEIKGSVEISGFSSQLVNVDENTILGIGYDDSSCNLKLALFDVTDPTKPTVLDSLELDNTSSNAQVNHKAIVFNEKENYYAFDLVDYNDDFESVSGAVVTINDGKIKLEKYSADLKDSEICSYVSRVAFIDDTIYALDTEGDIYELAKQG